jgi:carboxymethylenebutenolidase
MCSEFDALPPDVPADLLPATIAGGAAAELLELTSADGTVFSAALAQSPSADAAAPGIVVLPDVRGLYRFYSELAERFAAAGHHSIAIDYFGRTAGLAPRGEDFDFMTHMGQVRINQIQEDLAAAAAALRERTGVTSVAVVGFCFGGTNTYLASTNHDLDLSAFIAFYGALDSERMKALGVPMPLDHTATMRGPILGLFGGADAGIPVQQVQLLDQRLDEAGVEHDIHVYPGAPHSFFDRSFEEHAEACDDAWRRVLGFLAQGVPA